MANPRSFATVNHIPVALGIPYVSRPPRDLVLASNPVELQVLNITAIELTPGSLTIPAGSKAPLSATVRTAEMRSAEGVYLVWTENNANIARVSPSGMVFAYEPGQTEVACGDDQAECSCPSKVIVTETEDGGSGKGHPRVLLSEIDNDPSEGTPPIFNSADPPVNQRPQDVDRNIWWINMASPLARRYVDVAKGAGAQSQQWRVYHLERYIEVMVKIVLTHDFDQGDELSFDTMLRRWDEEAVNMQERISGTLIRFLDGGDLLGDQ